MQPPLIPLVETVLPFGRGFAPVSSELVAHRLDALFGLEGNAVFSASLASFSQLRTFPVGSQVLFEAERATAPDADVEAAIAKDARAFQRSRLAAEASFASLNA